MPCFQQRGQLQCSCSHLQIVSLTLNAQKSLEKVCLTSTSSTNPPQFLYVHVLRPCMLFSRLFSSCSWKAELNKTSNAGQPPWFVSVVLLPAPMISKMSLHNKIKTDQKRKNYKKHGSHLIFLKIIHHNPVPLRHLQYFWIFQGETGYVEAIGSDTVSVQQNLVLLSTNGCALAAQAAQVATFFLGAQGPNRRCSQAKQRHLKNTNGTCEKKLQTTRIWNGW